MAPNIYSREVGSHCGCRVVVVTVVSVAVVGCVCHAIRYHCPRHFRVAKRRRRHYPKVASLTVGVFFLFRKHEWRREVAKPSASSGARVISYCQKFK
jgi:hypothetical protein